MRERMRFASPQDCDALLEIYAPYVKNTSITFEYEVPSREEFAERIREISAFYPYLVFERDGRILGYAYAHRHQSRAAYQWGCELSVYLAPDARGQGIGTALYTALMRLLPHQNVVYLYACLTVPNERSAGLHEALGFVETGVWHHAGFKNGSWHDVVWYEKRAADGVPDAPLPLISVHDLPASLIEEVLATPIPCG